MLRLKKIRIDTYKENIAFLRKDSPLCTHQGFNSQTKIEIGVDKKEILAVLNVVEEPFLQEGEIGLCAYAFDRLGLPEGTAVQLHHPKPLHSFEAVKKKIAGHSFREIDLNEIIKDVMADRYSKIELTAFVLAGELNNLDRDEIVWLTRAMVETGSVIDWSDLYKEQGVSRVVDKHSVGGIPGNRTTMVVVPIVAAFGLKIPKTSSRAITSPAGTADVMETLTEVDIPLERLKEVVARENGCIAWGGALDLAPADDIIIQVERPLSMDSEGQMVASILSKKKAAGSTHVILDLPLGPTAKIRSKQKAQRLKNKFEYVSEQLNMYVECLITPGLQPVGRGIGPALEARDVLQVLRGDPRAPKDLREKSLNLAGRVLEFSPKVRAGKGYQVAREILDSGHAMRKMEAIMEAQGTPKTLYTAEYHYDVSAGTGGEIRELDNYKLARLASLTGAPADPAAGVDLFKKVGDTVAPGESMFRIYAENKVRLNFAKEYWEKNQKMIVWG